MFSSIMKELHEIRGDMNVMQGGFTAFHDDIALLRDRVAHNHSIPPSDRVGSRGGWSNTKWSDAAYSNHRNKHDYNHVEGWKDDAWRHLNRRERVPKFHREPHSRRVRDDDRQKMYEWSMEEEVSSKSRKNSNSQHVGSDTSRKSIPPKRVNLSHPSHHTKVSLWLSSNFPPSESLIQSKFDDVNHIVKKRVKHRVDFVDDDDEEQCEDEKESTATHEEDAHPTFNDDVSSIVEVEDEYEPLQAFKS